MQVDLVFSIDWLITIFSFISQVRFSLRMSILTEEFVDVGERWKELPKDSGDRLMAKRHQ